MKVLLRQDVSLLGIIGDVVDVRPGFARNYLLPQHLAVEPTDANVKRLDQERKERAKREKARLETLKGVASRLDGASVTIKAKANELGHLFGSVTERHIADALKEEGFEVDPEKIALAEPIRTLDKFRVPVHLADGVDAEIDVWVVPA
ncbi:MAG: 50S ribosomal protein L9 [Planctomycetota bacterium]|nr:50S ribosomal protein L9 [Planctomycetota bacterium]